ncbi:MAG: HAMP domain-containing protein [Clostridia bacterium]|nr:HAMP domain-containing protein [Clostridia bacterium]MBQ1435770.1 HAMP domain-containing protein [Clostridia bacterium]MBQ4249902.1 HAMP domain-containing protein [Clostridia bacterium]
MFKSLQMRMTFVLILLIVCIMMVVGTFILHGTTSFYIRDFTTKMNTVFTDETKETLSRQAQGENSYVALNSLLSAYSAQIGVTAYRNYYILDGQNAQFLEGTNPDEGMQLERTPNIITALSGEVGQSVSAVSEYMDYAVPVFSDDGAVKYIIYVKDTKEQVQDVLWMIFAVIVQAMMLGLIIAVGLSFPLARTITAPIGNITRGAKKLSDGDFGYRLDVTSTDEIGVLTEAFNSMADVINETMDEINQEKNKLETLFLYMTDGIVAFDPDGGLLHINKVCCDMFRVGDGDEITFDSLFSRTETGVTFGEVLSLERGKTLVYDVEYNEKFLEIIFARFDPDTQDGGILAIIHDVTQQQKLDTARREFIANVSHELRTPLTNIKSYTETVLESDDIPPELRHKFLGIVVNEADRMARIVKDLLVVSRLDNNRMDWKFSRFYPELTLRGTYEAVLMDAKRHSHNVTLNIENELGTMTGDKERIEQVIVNILSNAMKYTPDGGRIEVTASRSDDVLTVTVEDNGIGIPKKDLPRLFERFYRVDKARSRERGGTGLGLAIAREIVSAHGGTINIESELDRGTKVTITLPCRLTAPVTH